MDSAQVKAAFIKLKPLCDSFLNSPCKVTLNRLTKECDGLKPSILQEIHAYVLFPFTIHLRKQNLIKGMDLRMAMVQAVHDIFSRTHVDSVEMYFKYYYVLISQIFDKDSFETAEIDEDFTLIVVRAIITLTLRVPNDLRLKLYTRSNTTRFGQGIFVCVHYAKNVKFRALRIASINCILAMCTLHDDLMHELHSPNFNMQFAESVGDVLMFFLPGLLGAMQEVAKGDEKQGHIITCLAIKTISRVLCLTMMDQTTNVNKITDADFMNIVEYYNKSTITKGDEKPDPFGLKLRARGVEGIKIHLENAQRNKDWYEAAGEKLISLMKSLLPLQHHPHEKVRMEAAHMCTNIVTYCQNNMRPSLTYVIGMLIGLSEDDEPIRNISREALNRFNDTNIKMDKKQLLNILEHNLNHTFTKLLYYLHKSDGSMQLTGLRLLNGYLRMMCNPQLSPQPLTQILSCTYVMNQFAIALVEVFKFECGNIKLLEKCTLRDISTNDTNFNNYYTFMYLGDQFCRDKAIEMCKILGASECVEIIVDYFLEQYRINSECKKEIIFILNEVLTGSSTSSQEVSKNEHLIKDVINTYIDQENWYLPTSVDTKDKALSKKETLDSTVYNPRDWIKIRTQDLYEGAVDIRYTDISSKKEESDEDSESDDDTFTCRTLFQAQNNIMQICLMTEGIGKIALHLQENFQSYLLKTLYLILERAGSSIEMIHLAGMRALTNITKAFQFKNITELIKANADYFTHHVNIKLKKVTENPGVLDVLLVVMKYSEAEVLPCLYGIISNILDQRYKTHSQSNVIVFLKLFYAFVTYVCTKFPVGDHKSQKKAKHKNDPKVDTILYNLEMYKETYDAANNFEDDVSESASEVLDVEDRGHEESSDIEKSQHEENKEPPSHIKMVVSILKRTLNYVPSNDRDQKLLAVDIINEGIFFIRDWEDEVLPMVHQVWSPLVPRFKETSHPLIINRAFRLLITLATVSKDFIRKRTIDEVIPSLCNFLIKSAKDSNLKDKGSAYRFTQAYKLQLTLLENLGKVSILLNLQEKTIYDIMCATQEYLGSKQPKPLQVACVEMFKTLAVHNFGAVWLHLNGLCNDEEVNKSIEKLRLFDVKEFKCCTPEESETTNYKHNVLNLFNSIRNKSS